LLTAGSSGASSHSGSVNGQELLAAVQDVSMVNKMIVIADRVNKFMVSP